MTETHVLHEDGKSCGGLRMPSANVRFRECRTRKCQTKRSKIFGAAFTKATGKHMPATWLAHGYVWRKKKTTSHGFNNSCSVILSETDDRTFTFPIRP